VTESLDQLAAPPIFVVGYERSGTTLLFEAMESHPEVAGIFESWIFHERLGFAGLFDDAFWDKERAARIQEHVGRAMGIAQLVTRPRMIEELRALVTPWLASALRPEHRFLVEKTPVHLFSAPVIAELLHGSRFVEIVRDGRDVALSSLDANTGWGGQVGRRPGATRLSESARAWRINIATGRRHERLLADRWLRVRFEDLRADFPGTLRQVLAFCGIPVDDAIVERAREATKLAPETVTEQSFRRGGRVGGWRRRFSVWDAVAFDREAHAMLVQSGYAGDRRWVLKALRPRRRR
jgi:hypothetical protein